MRIVVSVWLALFVTGFAGAAFAGNPEKPEKAEKAEKAKAQPAKPAKPAKPARPGARGGKITICHRTGSKKKPYVELTVGTRGWERGHSRHKGDFALAPGQHCPGA